MLNDLDFADDIALLESSMSQAQSPLTRAADAAADLGLDISAPKTEFMTITNYIAKYEPVREFAMYFPTHGRMKPGRQRTLFTNYFACLLGGPNSLLNDSQLLEMAQDRHRWRKLVADCSKAVVG